MNDKLNLTELGVTEIEATAGTQVRRALNKPTIQEYTEWYRSGALFPPITVFCPKGAERYILADGFHRLEAAKEAGHDTIACDLREGDTQEALEHALGANEEHGLRRTSADKRNAIEIACRDPKWSKRSNRDIADLVKVDHKTVKKVRDQLHLTPEKVETKRTKKDGTPVEQPTKKSTVGNSPPSNGIDATNYADLSTAIAIVMSMPFDGDEAVERLKVPEDRLQDLEYCRDWFAAAAKTLGGSS